MASSEDPNKKISYASLYRPENKKEETIAEDTMRRARNDPTSIVHDFRPELGKAEGEALTAENVENFGQTDDTKGKARSAGNSSIAGQVGDTESQSETFRDDLSTTAQADGSSGKEFLQQTEQTGGTSAGEQATKKSDKFKATLGPLTPGNKTHFGTLKRKDEYS